MSKIFLDPGHGGKDSGAVFKNLIEKNMNLVISLACKEELVRHGVQVQTSRITDIYVSLDERCRMANAWDADYFVSIHNNAGGGDRGEVIHSIYRGKGLELANKIGAEMKSIGQQTIKIFEREGSSHKDYYHVIRNTNMNAVIVEGCFVDNEKDNDLLDTVEEQKIMGVAIAHGILKHLGITIKETTVEIPKVDQPKQEKPTPSPTPQPKTETKRVEGVAYCTVDILNVRNSATILSLKQGKLVKNEKVTIVDKNGDWRKVKYYNAAKKQTMEGWCSAKYLRIEKDFEIITITIQDDSKYATVTANTLNIRNGRGTNYKIIGKLTYGDRVKLLYLKDGWWSIDVPLSVSSEGVGFIHGDYVK